MISLQDYNIQFQDQHFKQLNEQLTVAAYSKIFVLVDKNTAQHCFQILAKALRRFELFPIIIEAGEQHKNIQTCQLIWTALIKQKADRRAVLINLGGGVIGDMGGFCASSYKRGIDFIQIPTTLLAQVDASIGGKLGIDFANVKNSIGLFKNPTAVYLFTPFFKTLIKKELYSGYAEVIKHALIQSQSTFIQLNQIKNIELLTFGPIIKDSLLIKKSIVEQDPFEQNIRKGLNFGHTIGHAIESLSWQTNHPLLHGEAVAIGMITETYLSHKLLGLSEKQLVCISQYLINLYPKYDLKQFAPPSIINLIQQDKKNEHQQVCFTLLEQIGAFKINIHASERLILEALNYYNKL